MVCLNRRVPTGTHGGVGAGEGDDPGYPIQLRNALVGPLQLLLKLCHPGIATVVDHDHMNARTAGRWTAQSTRSALIGRTQ
jgi:hypothetical protein